MYSLLPGEQGGFGNSLSIAINVDPIRTPDFACAAVGHTLPSSLTPGERRRVRVTVVNVGTATWPAYGSFRLYQRDGTLGSLPTPLNNRWGGTFCTPLSQPVAPGATEDFDIDIDAPEAGGTYSFRRQMFSGASPALGGVGLFSANQHCVDLTTTVSGSLKYDAVVLGHTLLPKMDPGGFALASVTLQNTGADPWPADGSLLLHSISTPISLFGRNATVIITRVLPGESRQVLLPVRAPLAPGIHEKAWRMFHTSGQYFGETLRVSTVVSTPPDFDADIQNFNLPTTMVAQASFSGLVEVRNPGPQTWPGDGTFGLEYIGLPFDCPFKLPDLRAPIDIGGAWWCPGCGRGGHRSAGPCDRRLALGCCELSKWGSKPTLHNLRWVAGVDRRTRWCPESGAGIRPSA